MQPGSVYLIDAEDVVEEPVFEVVNDLEGSAGGGSIVVFAVDFGEPREGFGVLKTMPFGIRVAGLSEEGFFVGEMEVGVFVEALEGLGHGLAGCAGLDGVVEKVKDGDQFFVLTIKRSDAD